MRNTRQGFTVMELVVVLAVIGVCAAMAVPFTLRYLSHGRLNGAARLIMSDMIWARMQAVTQRNAFRVFFLNDHVYEIVDDDNNNGQADDVERIRCRDIRNHYSDVSIGATADLIFFPRGNASIGTVTVTNKAGLRKIRVHLTGRIKIG